MFLIKSEILFGPFHSKLVFYQHQTREFNTDAFYFHNAGSTHGINLTRTQPLKLSTKL